jgi:hypothetical protein
MKLEIADEDFERMNHAVRNIAMVGDLLRQGREDSVPVSSSLWHLGVSIYEWANSIEEILDSRKGEAV